MDTWSYLRSQLSKQTNLVDLQLLSNYALFSKNWGRKLLKKNLEYESILYNSTELPVDWKSGEFQNETILFIFISRKIIQERIFQESLRYNIILNLLSPFHICF